MNIQQQDIFLGQEGASKFCNNAPRGTLLFTPIKAALACYEERMELSRLTAPRPPSAAHHSIVHIMNSEIDKISIPVLPEAKYSNRSSSCRRQAGGYSENNGCSPFCSFDGGVTRSKRDCPIMLKPRQQLGRSTFSQDSRYYLENEFSLPPM